MGEAKPIKPGAGLSHLPPPISKPATRLEKHLPKEPLRPGVNYHITMREASSNSLLVSLMDGFLTVAGIPGLKTTRAARPEVVDEMLQVAIRRTEGKNPLLPGDVVSHRGTILEYRYLDLEPGQNRPDRSLAIGRPESLRTTSVRVESPYKYAILDAEVKLGGKEYSLAIISHTRYIESKPWIRTMEATVLVRKYIREHGNEGIRERQLLARAFKYAEAKLGTDAGEMGLSAVLVSKTSGKTTFAAAGIPVEAKIGDISQAIGSGQRSLGDPEFSTVIAGKSTKLALFSGSSETKMKQDGSAEVVAADLSLQSADDPAAVIVLEIPTTANANKTENEPMAVLRFGDGTQQILREMDEMYLLPNGAVSRNKPAGAYCKYYFDGKEIIAQVYKPVTADTMFGILGSERAVMETAINGKALVGGINRSLNHGEVIVSGNQTIEINIVANEAGGKLRAISTEDSLAFLGEDKGIVDESGTIIRRNSQLVDNFLEGAASRIAAGVRSGDSTYFIASNLMTYIRDQFTNPSQNAANIQFLDQYMATRQGTPIIQAMAAQLAFQMFTVLGFGEKISTRLVKGKKDGKNHYWLEAETGIDKFIIDPVNNALCAGNDPRYKRESITISTPV